MIGRERTELGGERSTPEIGELVGMQLDRQAERLGRSKHARRLCRGERDVFHERIDGIGKAGLRHRRQHLVADAIDVALLVAIGFDRQRMGAEKAGADADGPADAEGAGCG